MRAVALLLSLPLCTALTATSVTLLPVALAAQSTEYARDPHQAIDESYTAAIRKYTTQPEFNSPLTDYLPASNKVPTPAKVLGDVSGAPDMLPYAEDVYRYFRALAAASPRVRVVTIGHTEEGREMIAVAVADEALLNQQKENDARLAQLADPRTIGMDDARAAALVAASTPVYYITGTIHSPETGAPTALMELAYRLAVDDAPYIRNIRSHVITLITPVVEVDGRDRMVDVYRWHKAHPGETYPHLLYWGHYVAHDNNRDAMTMTLALTRNVLNTYIGWHAQVLHDLHESVPFLYDNTVGDEPYNAWIDPILTNEWQMLGWSNVQEMGKLGMPGVFTHGDFDTWSPGYLMFLAAMHNGISRLYETFGNGGADTVERVLTPEEYARTWYRPNPPLPKVMWSQRDNNNYEQTALLTTLNYFAQNGKLFLNNYYLKSKRSIQKPEQNGPAAYVLSADEVSPSRQAMLLRILKDQHVEVQQTTAPVTVSLPAPVHSAEDDSKSEDAAKPKPPASRTFPAGSYVVRMDQPYSRIADALLDRQYWSPQDAQKHPYDDTGWTLGPLFGVDTARVLDTAILKAAMHVVADPTAPAAAADALAGDTFLIENHADPSLITLRYQLDKAQVSTADAPFSLAGHSYPAGTWIVRGIAAGELQKLTAPLHLKLTAASALPTFASHPVPAPRIALMHTWLDTQPEGWWRMALDTLHVPYSYISTQTAAGEADLRAKYDVILFAPIGAGSTERVLEGLPRWGNAMPWQKSDLTPNLGRIDSTADVRPGLGEAGLEHLRAFISQGGLFIAAQDAAQFAIETGLAPGVSIAPRGELKVVGTVVNTAFADQQQAASQPVLTGYSSAPVVYSEEGMAFDVSNLVTGDSRLRAEAKTPRPTGRGGPEDPDVPQDRAFAAPPAQHNAKPWEPMPLTVEQTRNNPYVIPEQQRPQVLLRYADGKDLLVSGLLDHPDTMAQHAAVVAAHLGSGSTLLFANNPLYRGETIGSYALVTNAILAWQPPKP